MGKRLFLASAGLACALAASAAAQDAPPAKPSSTVAGVTVVAPTPQIAAKRVEQFGEPDGKGRLARWFAPVCPATLGLPVAYDRFVNQRVRKVAAEVSAPVAGAKCQANILILVTPEPDRLAHILATRYAYALAGGRWPIEKAKLAAFAADTQPVRWLSMADSAPILGLTVDVDEQSDPAAMLGSGGLEAMFGKMQGPPAWGSVVPSRLTPAGDESISKVLVLVDAHRIEGLTAGQLADYLAMVSLAQIRSRADLSNIDTILALFAPHPDAGGRPDGLRPWDRSYLKGLYAAQAQTSYTAQVIHIAAHMSQELKRNAEPDGGK